MQSRRGHQRMTAPPDNSTVLDVRALRKTFPITQGFFKRVVGEVRAVDRVSFSIPSGQTLGLVGESGCARRPPVA